MSAIVGFKGQAGSGKDTVAGFLIDKYGFQKISFAAPLKEITSIITGWTLNDLDGTTESSRVFRETVLHPEYKKTARQLLQEIGTDLFRDHFDPEVWIKIARRRILALQQEDKPVVISDVRFPNEVLMLQDLGAQIWHIQRETKNGEQETTNSLQRHQSEQSFLTPGEVVIHNNGTVQDLEKIVGKLSEVI